MSRKALSVLLLAATALLAPSAAFAAPSPGTSATAGVRFGDDTTGGFVDLVLPVVATEKGIGFINPRFSLEDRQENELNLGAGWRQLAFGDRVLLGGMLGIIVEDLLGEGTDVTFSGYTVSVAQAGGAGIVVMDLMGGMNVSLIDNTVNLTNDTQVGIETLSISSSIDVTAAGNTVNAGTGAGTAGFLFSGSDSEVTLTASGNAVTGSPVVEMVLSNSSGTFVVNAAAPGAGGDLSGLNGGMGVSYSPDAAAFTFMP